MARPVSASFQFTPRREGRRRPKFFPSPRPLFQFTPLREGRLWSGRMKSWNKKLFQFTPLREGRLQRLRHPRHAGNHFNSRPSARGDVDRRRRSSVCLYFNSRPSARGDEMYLQVKSAIAISIHAPPRGATQSPFRFRPCRPDISIHAPPRGATRGITYDSTGSIIFQFTPLREGRPLPLPPRPASASNFNSRPAARGDAGSAWR